jgi:hypothetical protein
VRVDTKWRLGVPPFLIAQRIPLEFGSWMAPLRRLDLPCFNTHMAKLCRISPAILLLTCLLSSAQNASPNPPAAKPGSEYSGMYSFLQDGEFVQLTVEDEGRVTGFISRYGDLQSDKGEFLDLFFKSGKLDGKDLNFVTQTVHGVWYEFKGMVERGSGKNPGDEAYYVLKGILTQGNTDAEKKTSSKSRDAIFKSFPQDMGAPPEKKN